MSSTTVIVGVAIVYLGTCLVLGLWPGRRASLSPLGYVAGDRSLGLALTYFMTGATIFSAFAFLGAPGRAYAQGAAAFYILGYGAIGIIPYYFLGPRAVRVGRKYGFVTQAEMVAHRFEEPRLAAAMAIISIVAFVPYLALQMKGAGYVLESCSGGAVPAWLGALLTYTTVGAYVLRSGVLGVGWTNVFQGMFMMVLAWALGLRLPEMLHGGLQPMFEKIAAQNPQHLIPPGAAAAGARWTWSAYSSAVFVSAVGFTMWPHTFMRAFSAKNEEVIRRTVLLWPTFQLFLVPLFIIGFAGIGFTPAPPHPDQILPHLLTHLDLSPLVVGLFCAGALAASMSSGDTMAHAAGAIAIRDGAVTALGIRMDARTERAAIRVAIVLVLMTAYGLSIHYQGTLVYLLLASFGAVVQFAPSLVLALFDRRATGSAVLAGLIVGSGLTAVLVAWPNLRLFDLHAGMYGLLANVLVIAVMRARASSTPQPHADAFVHAAETSSER